MSNEPLQYFSNDEKLQSVSTFDEINRMEPDHPVFQAAARRALEHAGSIDLSFMYVFFSLAPSLF